MNEGETREAPCKALIIRGYAAIQTQTHHHTTNITICYYNDPHTIPTAGSEHTNTTYELPAPHDTDGSGKKKRPRKSKEHTQGMRVRHAKQHANH